MDTTSSPRQRLEDFRAFLAQPQDADSAHGTAEIWSRGQANKGGITGLVKCLDGSSARQAVRAQVKQLLKDNHIEITANIRKALPSRTAPGDAAALSQLLDAQALPLQVIAAFFVAAFFAAGLHFAAGGSGFATTHLHARVGMHGVRWCIIDCIACHRFLAGRCRIACREGRQRRRC